MRCHLSFVCDKELKSYEQMHHLILMASPQQVAIVFTPSACPINSTYAYNVNDYIILYYMPMCIAFVTLITVMMGYIV